MNDGFKHINFEGLCVASPLSLWFPEFLLWWLPLFLFIIKSLCRFCISQPLQETPNVVFWFTQFVGGPDQHRLVQVKKGLFLHPLIKNGGAGTQISTQQAKVPARGRGVLVLVVARFPHQEPNIQPRLLVRFGPSLDRGGRTRRQGHNRALISVSILPPSRPSPLRPLGCAPSLYRLRSSRLRPAHVTAAVALLTRLGQNHTNKKGGGTGEGQVEVAASVSIPAGFEITGPIEGKRGNVAPMARGGGEDPVGSSRV